MAPMSDTNRPAGERAPPTAAASPKDQSRVLAETVVASSGGTLTIDATDAQETLILIDLQTPI